MILDVKNFPPNDQPDIILYSFNDRHSQVQETEASTHNSNIELVNNEESSRTENLSVSKEPNSSVETYSTDVASSINTNSGPITTDVSDSSSIENQTSLQHV